MKVKEEIVVEYSEMTDDLQQNIKLEGNEVVLSCSLLLLCFLFIS